MRLRAPPELKAQEIWAKVVSLAVSVTQPNTTPMRQTKALLRIAVVQNQLENSTRSFHTAKDKIDKTPRDQCSCATGLPAIRPTSAYSNSATPNATIES